MADAGFGDRDAGGDQHHDRKDQRNTEHDADTDFQVSHGSSFIYRIAWRIKYVNP